MKLHALFAVLLSVSLSACTPKHSAISPEPTSDGCSQRTVERLYFGADTPKGAVGAKQWQKFLETEVTPRFSSGFTVIEAQGQWLGNNKKIVHEKTRIIELVHNGAPADYDSVAHIVESYKKQFQQEAVMRLLRKTIACF